MKSKDTLFLLVIQTELCRGYFVSTRIFSIPVPVKCLLIELFVYHFILSSFAQHCTCLFWFREFPSTLLNESVRALPAVCNSLTRLDAVCQNQGRVMACLGERSLSSGVLLQIALIQDCTALTTWLWEPIKKFWSWFHSLITRTLIHPLSCCKVEMLPEQLPTPTLLYSARHRWMSAHIRLHNGPLLYFTLNYASVWQWIVTHIYATAMWCTYTLFYDRTRTCCLVFLIMWPFILGLPLNLWL